MTVSVVAGLVLAAASAVALNWGYYAQHGATSALPPLTLRHPLRSLVLLFRNRRWVVGFVTGIGGWVLYVAALALAPLSLVQAAAAGGIGVLAVLVRSLSTSERLAVGFGITGLGLLALSLGGGATHSTHGSIAAPAAWMIASVAVAAAVTLAGRGLFAGGAAFGVAAGVLYAAGDVGTKAALGGGSRFWFVPALLACHGLAFVILQLGFQRGGVLATAGMATLWTNALPIAAGMILFGEPLPGGGLGVVRVAAFVAVLLCAFLLSRTAQQTAAVAAAIVVVALAVCGGAVADSTAPLPGFRLLQRGFAGGTVWTGRIPNPFVPSDMRYSDVYLPPFYDPQTSYPVLYLLHGFWGSPSSFVDGLRFMRVADELISAGRARPFIAVMPPGGPLVRRTQGEWAGVWEKYVVHTVVPWTDSHLSTEGAAGRAIGGLSSGGYGAIDIALRHPGMFQTAESWEGYFSPFRDGPFVHASPETLEAHDPSLLVEQRASALRRIHFHVFLSSGRSHGAVKREWTVRFADELKTLRIRYRLWLYPNDLRKGFLRAQLADALLYAEPL